MGSRNRVIYQSESLYVSDDINSTSASTHNELIRVQSANYGFTINRQDVNQYGNLSRIDSLVLESPTVNFDFSYYLSNGSNENFLGFDTKGTSQFVSGFLSTSSGKNFYIITSEEGQDSTTFEDGDPYSIIGIGNSFLSDYTVDLSVGALPTASVSFEASNINSQNGLVSSSQITGSLPSITPQNGTVINGAASINIPSNTGQGGPTALRPGDISLSFPGFDGGSAESGTISTLSGVGGFHIQSASISIPLSRTPIERVGSKFPFARVVDFPVNATMSVNAVLNTVEAGNLANMIAGCGGDSNKEVAVTINSCEGDPAMSWTLKGATLDSESWSSSIGSNKAVDLTFGVQLGGIDDLERGIIYSGSYSEIPLFTTVYFDEAKTLEASGIQGDIPTSWMFNRTDISGVTFGSSPEYIGNTAFEGTDLTEVIIDETQGNNITGLGIRSFYNIGPITGITIGSNVKRVGNSAFSNAGRGVTTVSIDVDAEEIGGSSFSSLISANSIILGDNVKSIENSAFYRPSAPYINPETFYIGTGVTGIGADAFRRNNYGGWTGELNLPSAINIGTYAFAYWSNVTGLNLSENLETIGVSAFEGTASLGSLVIPSGVISIKTYAFRQSLHSPSVPGAPTSRPNVEINCPTGAWDGLQAFTQTRAATYTITGTYYQDYTGSSWSVDQDIAPGSTIISGTY